jgi:hypothetical protein
MGAVSVRGPDFDRLARRLGWELAPDLGRAEHAVERRAAELAAARGRRRAASIRVALVATLAVAVMAAASPALIAGFGGVVRYHAATTTAAPTTVRPELTNSQRLAGLPDTFIDVPAVGLPVPHTSRSSLLVAACSREEVTLETEFGREVYAPGDAATVTLVLRNASAAACSAVADRCTSEISVSDASGAGIYSSLAHRYLCQAPGQAGPAPALRQVLEPGQAMTMTFRWLEQSCSGPAPGPGCSLAAPGRYTVTGGWAGFPTAGDAPAILSADYRLTSLPRHVTIA